VWDRLLEAVSKAHYSDVVMIDSTCVRAHQHAATGKRGWKRWWLGTFRRGLTSKSHALVDGKGRPVNLRLTGGQIADCTKADALIDGLGKGNILLADKGYDSDAIRAEGEALEPISRQRPIEREASRFRTGSTGNEISWKVLQQDQTVPGYRYKLRQKPGNYLAAVKFSAARIWCQIR
jgi:transposase